MKDVDAITLGFINYLKKNRKIQILPEIIKKLKDYFASQKNKVVVITTIPLVPKQKNLILSYLNKKIKQEFILDYIVNKKILGGIIIKINDQVLDLSLNNKLKQLQQTLL